MASEELISAGVMDCCGDMRTLRCTYVDNRCQTVSVEILWRVPVRRAICIESVSCTPTRREVKLNEWWLLWGLLFGAFGFAYFMYGKKQKAVVPLVCGLVLMIFPYFVANTIALAVIGIALIFIPYFVRI